jgi:hypothetical protein
MITYQNHLCIYFSIKRFFYFDEIAGGFDLSFNYKDFLYFIWVRMEDNLYNIWLIV